MYDYLYKQIFSNRWLVWFFIVSCCVAVGLLGYIHHSFVEMQNFFPGNNVVAIHQEDSIKIRKPSAHETVKSPLNIVGDAKGTWFFKENFPVKLLDEKGNIIKIAIAKANPPAGGDGMTEDFVPFFVRIDFDIDRTMNGTIVFQKDNPSGLPGNDFEFVLPVVLSAD